MCVQHLRLVLVEVESRLTLVALYSWKLSRD